MKNEKDSPAFPSTGWDETGKYPGHFLGLTLRQYAAIKLKVPDSGIEWLDSLIRQSLRDELAGKAMQGMLAQSCGTALRSEIMIGAKYAYSMADAMIKEKECK